MPAGASSSAPRPLPEQMLDEVPALISYIDQQGRYRFVNRAYEEWFGRSRSAVAGKTMLEVLGSDAYKAIEPHVTKALAGERVTFTAHVPYQHGGARHIQAAYVPQFAADGTQNGFLAYVTDITQSKLAEALLRVKDAQLEAVTDVTPAMLTWLSRDQTYLYANRAYANMLGRTPESIIGKNVSEVIGFAAYEAIQPYVRQVLAGQNVDYEQVIPFDTVGARMMRVAYRPSRNDLGEVTGWVASLRDVTEERRGQSERARLAAIVESSNDAIIAKTLDGVITDWNSAAERVFGYAANEMLGRPITMLIPLERLEEEAMILDRLKRGERIEHYETVRVRKGGRRIDVSLSVSPIKDAAGKIIGASKIVRDITEQKRSAAALRQHEQRLAAIFSASAVGAAVLTPDGRFLQVNDSFCDIAGYPREELLSRTCQSITHVEDVETMMRLLDRLIGGAIPSFVLEKRFVRKDGTPIWTQNSVSLTRDVTGQPSHLVALSQDITGRKRAEEQIKASLHEKEVLLKEIHHRVKNNLQIVSSLLNLQSDHFSDPALVARFEESKNRIHSMALVHEQLYRTSDLSTIRMDLYVRSLVEQLFCSFGEPEHVLLEVHADDTGLNLDLAIPCGLVLNELISNALKHAFPGSRRGRIRITLNTVSGSRYRLAVEDDGAGLPDGFALETAESLGLRLIHTLVGQLHGTLRVSGSGGTSFMIEFPMTSPVTPPAPETA